MNNLTQTIIAWQEKHNLYSIDDDQLGDLVSMIKQDKDVLIKRIEAIKEKTQEYTGSFKYDVCYDECIEVINKHYV